MKYLRFTLIIIAFLTLVITVASSHSVSNTLPSENKSISTQNTADYKNKNLPLHGDVWFAFAAIGAISTYLAFKRK